MKLKLLSLVLATAALTGCATSDSSNTGSFLPIGRTQTVSIQDSSARIHLDTKVALNDIIAFSENLTNKMLASPVFKNAKNKPKIVVGKLRNTTHDENIRIQEIQETLFNSGVVRVLDGSATNFNYIMQTEITDTVQRAPDGQKMVDYSMKIKLFNVSGELVGQWSDDLSLFKSR
ncbi:hypothetical protein [uncultured Parasutterella sp.]|uniref:hypothetical protein n=1 Tax=uncultured Parasutterella sp. TaxID=1263098 RepID=UPI002596A575|nr:hypothetical protein [uncultured Parasutterella sp.]